VSVVEPLLREVVEAGGSDLHLTVPAPPLMRLNGELVPAGAGEPLEPGDTQGMLGELLEDESKREEFSEEGEVDFSFALDGCGRFRVNAFRQRGTVSLALRVIPNEVQTVEELGLPEVISDLADEERGIVLVTGTTGSGKSTTLAAMVDRINETKSRHIVTIEDPIEFLHRNKRSVVAQREVGDDTVSFTRALRRVLRQDPDVILIGEMRDEETVKSALSAAATGHLVLSTLHTLDAAETINRVIDFFPPHQQQQTRSMLSGTLKGIVSQRLVPTKDGEDRVPVCEVLRSTGRVRDMILDASLTEQLPQAIAEGEYYGMQSFDQALLKQVQAGRISLEEGLRAATRPSDFKLLVASEGVGGPQPMREREAPEPDAPQAPDAEAAASGSPPTPPHGRNPNAGRAGS
jgi:twitching motility protein PilT